MINKSDLDTGDILFFHSNSSYISKTIEWFTSSNVAHTGIVIKDPWFNNNNLNGLYLLESTCDNVEDVEDKKIKWGVKLCKLDDVIAEYDKIYVRKLNTVRNKIFKDTIENIYNDVKNIPYDLDINNWYIAALNHLGISESKVKKHKNKMWCSALVGFIYLNLGYIDKNIDYSNLAPSDIEIIDTIPNNLLEKVTELNIMI